MKIKEIRYETNQWGKYKIIEQTNGITIRLLREPSQKYLDLITKRKAADAPKEARRRKEEEKQRLIQEEMKNLAIENLKKAGKLDENGEPIL